MRCLRYDVERSQKRKRLKSGIVSMVETRPIAARRWKGIGKVKVGKLAREAEARRRFGS